MSSDFFSRLLQQVQESITEKISNSSAANVEK